MGVILWALKNWRLVLAVAVVGGLALFAGWQYVGRVQAEKALGDYKLDQAEEDNKAWRELDDKRQAFEAEVREGFERLQIRVDALHVANQEFQARVKANANSNRPLDPVERDALGMLRNLPADQAGGGAVQPPAQSPPVRGGQGRH